MKKNKLVLPFLKWVGGKRQLITEIKTHIPSNFSSYKYFEPFIGGGALLFNLQPNKAVISDFNEELINVYFVIRDNLDELIEDLKTHRNNSEYFYEIRALDRSPIYQDLTNIQKASRVIFLNKTCYNGLYRVNSSGEFNSPFGNYKNPNIVNEPVLRAVNSFLNNRGIDIFSGDYLNILQNADRNSFVYLDPPYDPVSESSNFTGYVQGGWTKNDQIRLRETCDMLTERKVKFLLSNSSTDFIRDQYSSYSIHTVQATRLINSDSTKRGAVSEFLIKNYE